MAEVGRALARQEKEKSPEIVNVELNLEEPPLFGGRVSVGENGYREYIQECRKSERSGVVRAPPGGDPDLGGRSRPRG